MGVDDRGTVVLHRPIQVPERAQVRPRPDLPAEGVDALTLDAARRGEVEEVAFARTFAPDHEAGVIAEVSQSGGHQDDMDRGPPDVQAGEQP
jgi:hypothetical protein